MHYAIGDIQGNFSALKQLLNHINFNPKSDYLYFLGDVVNRGEQSLETLSFIKDLHHQNCADMVLGNHDFFLLMCAYADTKPKKKDTISLILNSKNKMQLLDFLRSRPVFIKYHNNILTHAGVPPQWDLKTLTKQAKEVENSLKQPISKLTLYLKKTYYDQAIWHTKLSYIEQQCYTINALMRMRFCTISDELEFQHKANQHTAPNGFKAWFSYPRKTTENIIFGHWSSLLPQDEYSYPAGIYPMDTACIWGEKLSAICLENKKITQISC